MKREVIADARCGLGFEANSVDAVSHCVACGLTNVLIEVLATPGRDGGGSLLFCCPDRSQRYSALADLDYEAWRQGPGENVPPPPLMHDLSAITEVERFWVVADADLRPEHYREIISVLGENTAFLFERPPRHVPPGLYGAPEGGPLLYEPSPGRAMAAWINGRGGRLVAYGRWTPAAYRIVFPPPP